MGFLFTWLLCSLSILNNSAFPFLGWVTNTKQTANSSYSTETTSSSVLAIRDAEAVISGAPECSHDWRGFPEVVCALQPRREMSSSTERLRLSRTKDLVVQMHYWKSWEAHVGAGSNRPDSTVVYAHRSKVGFWNRLITRDYHVCIKGFLVYLSVK